MRDQLASTGAGVSLVLLTLLTWRLAEGDASAWFLVLVTSVKIGLIGVVFLQMLRSRPVWIPVSIAVVVGVLGGSAWLIVAA
ncbi:MAG: hypothetical protein ACI9MC_001671 [Kiritimatiellia bacterium]|jgi:hypothetical protein